MVPQDITEERHYYPEKLGAWDRQLPNPDLVNQLPAESPKPKKRRKTPNWPDLLTRMKWAYERTVAMGLNGVEAAIFKHVVYVDGIGEGFFQHQKTITQETGWKHAAISRALASLTKKGLLEATPRMGRTTKCCLIGLATMPSEPISLRDDYVSLRDDDISETDAVDLSKRQQNPERNQEELTAISPPELSERREFKNIPGDQDQDDQEDDPDNHVEGDPDDQWEPPALAPKLFRNPLAYAQFVGAFQSGELTREWAHALSQHGGGMTPQETWAYEEWFDKTRRITASAKYEKLIEENIRRYQEEHGPAPVVAEVQEVEGEVVEA